jgi:hypothetical protein
MISETYLLDFLDDEIHFYQEAKGPLRYRLLCWLFRIKPRNRMVIEELEFIQTYIAAMAQRDHEKIVSCQGCTDKNEWTVYSMAHNEWKRWVDSNE